MGAVVAAAWWGWSQVVGPTKINDMLGLLVVIGVGVAAYGALLWTMKIEGRDDLAGLWTRFRKKLPS